MADVGAAQEISDRARLDRLSYDPGQRRGHAVQPVEAFYGVDYGILQVHSSS
jgi:hypothetical protein